MKNTKLSKIILLALSVAVLVGCALAFSVSAAEEENDGIVLKNLYYDEKVAILFAVDATVGQAENGDVTVEYYWDDATDDVKQATYYPDDGTLGTDYPVFITEGLAAKELGKLAHVTFTDASGAKHEETYSVAEYLYKRLYVDGFAAKTEADVGVDGKDYNRKLLYQNLLNYGEQAQIVFDHNGTRLTEYSFAYTTNKDVKLNGASYVFGAETVTATYSGAGSLESWISIDTEGVETVLASADITVDGVIKIGVKLGDHTCADVDPKDHKCDTCSKTLSECKNENADHLCDICGVVVSTCTDANSDGKCDVCGVYNFNVESIAQTDKFTIYNAAWNGGTNTAETSFSISNTLTYNSARPADYNKGPWWSIIDNPTNAADKVIRMNTISGWSGSGAYISHMNWAPDVAVENGDLVVFEFEFNQITGATGKESFYFYTVYEDGTIKNNRNAVYTKASSVDTDGNGEGDTNGVRLNPDTAENAHYFAYGEWAKVRVVCDNTNKKIYYFYTIDDGASWIQCATVDSYASNSNVASIGFANKAGTFATTVAFDNVKCVKTTAEAYGITLN